MSKAVTTEVYFCENEGCPNQIKAYLKYCEKCCKHRENLFVSEDSEKNSRERDYYVNCAECGDEELLLNTCPWDGQDTAICINLLDYLVELGEKNITLTKLIAKINEEEEEENE